MENIKKILESLKFDLENQIKDLDAFFEKKISELVKKKEKECSKIIKCFREKEELLQKQKEKELFEVEVRYMDKRIEAGLDVDAYASYQEDTPELVKEEWEEYSKIKKCFKKKEEELLQKQNYELLKVEVHYEKRFEKYSNLNRKKKKLLVDEYKKNLETIRGGYILMWFNKKTATSNEILFEDITALKVDKVEITDTVEISEIFSENCVGITYLHSKNNSLPKFIRTEEGKSYKYEFPENYGIQEIDEKIYDKIEDLIYNTETGERYLMMGEKLKIIKDFLKELGYKEKTIIIETSK